MSSCKDIVRMYTTPGKVPDKVQDNCFAQDLKAIRGFFCATLGCRPSHRVPVPSEPELAAARGQQRLCYELCHVVGLPWLPFWLHGFPSWQSGSKALHNRWTAAIAFARS